MTDLEKAQAALQRIVRISKNHEDYALLKMIHETAKAGLGE